MTFLQVFGIGNFFCRSYLVSSNTSVFEYKKETFPVSRAVISERVEKDEANLQYLSGF